jgi:hypothetical protein
MLITWLNMLVLCAPAYLAQFQADDDGAAQPVTIIVRCTDDGQTTAEAGATPRVFVTAGPRGQHVVTGTVRGEEGLPKVWIGVRLTPVPAPLAAHIGERGVMVANVVKGSPADAAGLEQYDVVTSYNGQDINRPQDLTAAIAKTQVGQAAKLAVVRKGSAQELAIAPAARPTDAEVEWKYAEPQDAAVDAAVKMYGRALQRDPSGNWTMKDLGQLSTLPDTLKKLEDLDLNVDMSKLHEELDKLNDPNGPLKNMDVRIWRGLQDGEPGSADEDKNVRVEVKIKIEDDGKKTTIETGADGKITVTHTDADGNESSATYDNAEALEKADPEAFKCYSEHCVLPGGGKMWQQYVVQPFGHHTLKLQHEFQVDVEKKLQEALDAAKKARIRVGQARDEALKEYQQKLGQTGIELRHGGAPAGESELLMVRVNPDGTIKVTVEENGEQTTHEFKSKDEFKASTPELYQKVQGLLE